MPAILSGWNVLFAIILLGVVVLLMRQQLFLKQHISSGYPFPVCDMMAYWSLLIWMVFLLAVESHVVFKVSAGIIRYAAQFLWVVVSVWQLLLLWWFLVYAFRTEDIWDRSSYSPLQQYRLFATNRISKLTPSQSFALYDEIMEKRENVRGCAHSFLGDLLSPLFKSLLSTARDTIHLIRDNPSVVTLEDKELLRRFWRVPYPFTDACYRERYDLFVHFLISIKEGKYTYGRKTTEAVVSDLEKMIEQLGDSKLREHKVLSREYYRLLHESGLLSKEVA